MHRGIFDRQLSNPRGNISGDQRVSQKLNIVDLPNMVCDPKNKQPLIELREFDQVFVSMGKPPIHRISDPLGSKNVALDPDDPLIQIFLNPTPNLIRLKFIHVGQEIDAPIEVRLRFLLYGGTANRRTRVGHILTAATSDEKAQKQASATETR